ncbi:MAG: hypothetical protein WAV56_01715 [Microgenomates group bacterium]
MVLSDGDLKKIGKVVDEKIFQSLDQMVLPELMKLEKKMATKDDLKIGLAGVEERLTNRIDRVAGITTDTRTNHERRIRKLEDETGMVPEERLTL